MPELCIYDAQCTVRRSGGICTAVEEFAILGDKYQIFENRKYASIFKFNYTNICFYTPAGNILGISPLFRLRKT